MKKLSGPLGMMWESDQNKALWSLMTKAWSIVRDQISKEKASLSVFFSIMCPYLNIISPETYFERLGWELTLDKENNPSLSRVSVPALESLDIGINVSTLSVEDIILHCQSMGYAQEYVFDMNNLSSTFLAPSTQEALKKLIDPLAAERDAVLETRRAKRNDLRKSDKIAGLRKDIAATHEYDASTIKKMELDNDIAIFLLYPTASRELPQLLQPQQSQQTGDAFRVGADTHATLPNLYANDGFIA